MYAENPDVPFCFGDFRLENIVVKTMHGEEPKTLYENTFGQHHIVDVRQIDFDFCAAVQACGLTKKQYEAVLKMCLTMFQVSETYDYWFDSGFMFADYLRANFEDLYNALSCIYVNADNDTLINLTRQTGLPWITIQMGLPWKKSFEAVINNIRKRLSVAAVNPSAGESKTTDGLAMSSVSLLKRYIYTFWDFFLHVKRRPLFRHAERCHVPPLSDFFRTSTSTFLDRREISPHTTSPHDQHNARCL